MKTYKYNLDTLIINHTYETRPHAQSLLKTHKFETTKGRKSKFHNGVCLFIKYFENSDFRSLTLCYVS